MLTPAQIRAHRFISAVRGTYKADDVDSYFEEVVASYEQAFKENADLIKKIGLLAERVEAYRNDEENIKSTLLTAQRAADNLIRESSEKSEEMLKAAEEKLEYEESRAKSQAQMIQDETNKAVQEKIADAEEKSNQMISDASKEAQRLLDDSKRESVEQLKKIKDELQKETLCLEILKKESAAFKDELLGKYRQHMEFIGAIPGAVAATVQPEKAFSFSAEDDLLPVSSAEEVVADADDSSCEQNEDENDNILNMSADKPADDQSDADDNDSAEDPEYAGVSEEKIDGDKPSENDSLGAVEDVNAYEEDIPPQAIASATDEPVQAAGQKDIENAIEEIEEFLSDSEHTTTDFMVINAEQEGALAEDNSADTDKYNEGVATDTGESSAEGSPNLFSLRQRAFAQQQEEPVQDEPDAQAVPSSDEEEEDIDDTEEDEGFRVYLGNLDADDDALTERLDAEPADNKGLFETVEYDDDDDDDNGDGESHPRFKGFFKK